MCKLVMVYGTLKKGHSNHSVMKRAGGELVGEHTVDGNFSMISMGTYPGALLGVRDGVIKGEVYKIKNIQPLDSMEGYPHGYNREIVSTPYGPAWMYYLNKHHYNDRIKEQKVIESGVWEKEFELYRRNAV